MKILVVGLGLIGGSICKALKKYTDYTVIGSDLNKETEQTALAEKSIDTVFSGDFSESDLVIICLYPEAAEKYFAENASSMSSGTLVTDVCGIKGSFAERMKKIAADNSMEYIGIHPMAGKEFGGYANSTPDLFVNANFIVAPFEDSSEKNTDLLKKLAQQMEAGKIVVTSPENHDKMIAYTSQLAHIVSSAYVKSPELELECGFSGGSFQDMTRIATMNEVMWTDLFMQNKENLKFELDTLVKNLKKYSDALENSDAETMRELIREGRILKEENLKRRIGQPN
ncbi:MAG: prephenate dehydrogenase [Ruminococcus sp.]|nr:prephenate dehydrogenase [Ruminococcus sp.]